MKKNPAEKIIRERLEPGALSIDGFLGHDERPIADIIAAFSEPGDEVLTAEGTFIGLYVSTNKHGRVLNKVPLKNYEFDLNAIVEAIKRSSVEKPLLTSAKLILFFRVLPLDS